MASEGSIGAAHYPVPDSLSSRYAFPPTNGIRQHPGMDTVRSNIRRLMAGRSINEVAEGSGVGQTWLQRYLNPDKPSGIKKANPEKLEQLARYFGVSAGDLLVVDLAQVRRDKSQPVGQERQIVAAAVKLVQHLQDFAVEPIPPERYADLLYVAMLVAREEGAEGILSGETIIPAAKRFARELRATGG